MLEDYDEDIIEYAVNYKDGKSDSFYIVGKDLCLDEQPIDVIEDLNDDNESVRKIIDYVKNNIDKEIKSLEIIEDGVGHTIDFEFVLNFNPKETRKPTVNELSGLFARRIVKLYQFLTEQQVPHEYNMSRNALLTGTSIGSLLLKTDYPQSRDEYFQYVSRALDQARECQYWINLLHDSQYLSEEQFTSIQDDLKSILNILWAIIRSRKKTALPSNNQRLNPE